MKRIIPFVASNDLYRNVCRQIDLISRWPYTINLVRNNIYNSYFYAKNDLRDHIIPGHTVCL